jgi:hypothetical protein
MNIKKRLMKLKKEELVEYINSIHRKERKVDRETFIVVGITCDEFGKYQGKGCGNKSVECRLCKKISEEVK